MFLLSSGKIPANLGWSFPWYFSLLFFLGAIGCGYFAIKLSDKTEKQCAIVHMAGRPNLNDSEFGQHFFPPDRAEFAARLRQILSRHIAVDLSQMQPDDRLVEDLRMDAMDSLSTVEYVIEIEKEFEITIPNAAAEKMRTFQSVVDYVAGAVKAKEV
jgi:acyl carrier protein